MRCELRSRQPAWSSFAPGSLIVVAVGRESAPVLAVDVILTSPSPVDTHPVSSDFVSALFVFMLAAFVGLEVVRRVSRLLHTPLMSLTNAISAIAVVGAILVAGSEHPPAIHLLGLVAVAASVANVVSGFLITDRMVKLFKKRGDGKPK